MIAAAALCATLTAQPLDRLTGRVLTEQGRPLKDADIRIEAAISELNKSA